MAASLNQRLFKVCMSHAFYKPTTNLLKQAGFELLRKAQGSHETWRRKDGKQVTLTRNLNDRNLANRVLRIAGIKDAKL